MEKATRRRRRDDAANAANIKLSKNTALAGSGSLADKFAASLQEKESRKQGLEMLEGAYKKMAEKKKMETERFKHEIAKMMDSDEDDSLEKRREARKKQENKLRKPGKLKGKWDNFAKDQEEAERKKLDSERKKREKRDREERIKAKRDLEEKGEDVTDHSKMLNSKNARPTRKPTKIKTNFEDLAQRKEEERLKKIAEDRYNRILNESKQMKAEKSTWENGIGPNDEQLDDTSLTLSREPVKAPKKLNLNFAELEAQRQREAEELVYQERVKRLREENERMQQEYQTNESQQDDNDAAVRSTTVGINSERVAKPGKITGVNFLKDLTELEKLNQELARITDDKHKLEKIIKEKEEDIRLLIDVNPLDFPDREAHESYLISVSNKVNEHTKKKNQHQELLLQTSCAERQIMRAIKIELEKSGQKGSVKKEKTLDKSKTQFDQLEKERRKKEEDKLYQEKMAKLDLERARMKHEQKLFEIEQREKMHQEALEDSLMKDFEPKSSSGPKPKKLDSKFTMLDAHNHSRILEERQDLNRKKMEELQEEMRKFKEQQAQQQANGNDSSDEDDSGLKKTVTIEGAVSKKKPGKVNVAFDRQHAEELEKQRQELHAEKLRLLEEEIHFMKTARRKGSSASEEDFDVKSRCHVNPIRQDDVLLRAPKKLNKKVFEMTDLDKKRQIEQERIKAERDEKLRQERELFARQAREQNQDDDDIPREREASAESLPKSPTKSSKSKKINADNYLKMLQEQQRKQDEEALMEQRFERMAMEQQEMLISARKNEMDEQFYASEDEVSYSESEEDDYDSEERAANQASGAPIFIEHLEQRLEVMEGHPVRFDAKVNMYPHGNVIWYYNRRPIRSSEDYQYISQGNSYSLYMPETYIDDSGEYICKIENSKGSATSICKLTIQEDPSLGPM